MIKRTIASNLDFTDYNFMHLHVYSQNLVTDMCCDQDCIQILSKQVDLFYGKYKNINKIIARH